MHAHTFLCLGHIPIHRLYRPVVKPGRCAVDTWTITLCVLRIPVSVCVCVCVLTDFCLFSQTLPVTECSMPCLQLLQLFHSPSLSLWKKSLGLYWDTQQWWQLPQTGADNHQNRCLHLHAGFMMSATLFKNSRLSAGFQRRLSCSVLSCPWSAVQTNHFPSVSLFSLLSPRLPGESVLKLWQTAV